MNPTRVHVRNVHSTGHQLIADVTLELGGPETRLNIRAIRAYRDRQGVDVLAWPHTKTSEGEFVDAINLPKAWRPQILDAIFERAVLLGLTRPA